MGILLLFARIGALKSSMYDATREAKVQMGNVLMFITNGKRFIRYMRAILIGLPVWYVIGVLISFSDEFAKQFGITGFDQPKSLMLQYVALAFGDMGAGLTSNFVKSRKKTLIIWYGILAIFIVLFFALRGGGNAFNMYLLCMGLGFGSGLSVLYITMSAEQFGTNLRATAAISIPNLVRRHQHSSPKGTRVQVAIGVTRRTHSPRAKRPGAASFSAPDRHDTHALE